MDQPPDSVKQALEFFGLSLPIAHERLAARRRELLHTWYPARYANLTNNPKKYMQMFQQAEEMTRRTEAAYTLLLHWLQAQSTEGSR
jgi:hypothetical protein